MTTQPPDQDNPPAWAVEGVRLSAYDPRWPGHTARHVDELRPVLDQWLLPPDRACRPGPPSLASSPNPSST